MADGVRSLHTWFSQAFSYIIELRKKDAVKWCNFVIHNYIHT